MTTEATAGAPAGEQTAGTPATELPGTQTTAAATPPADALVLPDAAAEAAKAAAEAATKPAEVFTYNASGDPGLDLALDFIGNLGFGPEHAAVKAAESGDFAALEDALKGLGDKAKGWEKLLAAGKAGFARLDAAGKERAGKTTAAILEIAGGAEQWGKIQKWAGENATPEERSAVNTALKSGGLVAKAVARELAALWMKQPNAEKAGQAARPSAAPAAGTTTSMALSPQQYKEEVGKLSAKMGSRMDRSPEYRSLQARRQAWKA